MGLSKSGKPNHPTIAPFHTESHCIANWPGTIGIIWDLAVAKSGYCKYLTQLRVGTPAAPGRPTALPRAPVPRIRVIGALNYRFLGLDRVGGEENLSISKAHEMKLFARFPVTFSAHTILKRSFDDTTSSCCGHLSKLALKLVLFGRSGTRAPTEVSSQLSNCITDTDRPTIQSKAKFLGSQQNFPHPSHLCLFVFDETND